MGLSSVMLAIKYRKSFARNSSKQLDNQKALLHNATLSHNLNGLNGVRRLNQKEQMRNIALAMLSSGGLGYYYFVYNKKLLGQNKK